MSQALPEPEQIPRVGAVATVRNRRGVISSIDPYDGDAGRLHLVYLEYKDDLAPKCTWHPTCGIPSGSSFSVHANFGRIATGELDTVLARYRAERSLASLGRIVEIVDREAPLIPLTYGTADAAFSTRVEYFKASPLGIFPLSELVVEPNM